MDTRFRGYWKSVILKPLFLPVKIPENNCRDAFEGITDSEICAGALLPLNKSMPLSNRPLTIGLPQIG